MNILLVYPEYPDTFWSFSYALKFISKKAAYPPLGLLTVAAMLPPEWDKRLLDMNVRNLDDRDLLWADYVFISAMSIQRESVKAVIARCRELGTKVVAGGPLFQMTTKSSKTWTIWCSMRRRSLSSLFLRISGLDSRSGSIPQMRRLI